MNAVQGKCKTCGEVLVQVRTAAGPVRTYHPAIIVNTAMRRGLCAAMLFIPGTTVKGFDVDPEQFEQDKKVSEA